MSPRLRDETGVAMITAVFLAFLVSVLIVSVIAASIHSNEATSLDRHRENAFQAASAGVDVALDCLAQLTAISPFSSCSKAADATTILSDGAVNTGQYASSVSEITPLGSSTRIAQIVSTGYGPTQAESHAARSVRAEVTMVPASGFFDTLFAGGSSPMGVVTLKNNGVVNGSIYAASFDTQQNNGAFGDVRVVGDFNSKNNDNYRSVWAGGNVSMSNHTVVATNAKACGAGSSPGDATLASDAEVVANLQYKGTFTNNGGTVGSLTHAACAAPPSLGLPVFNYSALNYPGWTILDFTTVAAADACLATAGSTQLLQLAACGATLGDKDRTVGKNFGGALVHVNAATCPSTVTFAGATFTGNFTIVSNCKLSVDGNLTLDGSAVGSKQAVFISTSSTGTDDLSGTPNSSNAALSVLMYSTGETSTKNSLTIAAGALYGANVTVKNNISISSSSYLGSNPPPGFTFDPSVDATFTPVLREWREGT
jgi:hypothetical protein